MQFRQENLHLREARDALASLIAPVGRSLSAFAPVVGSEGHGCGDSGEVRTTGQGTMADGVDHDAGPSEWSLISDVVFCGQNQMCMPHRMNRGVLSTTGSCSAKPVGSSSGCGDDNYKGTDGCDGLEGSPGRIITGNTSHFSSCRLWLAGTINENRVVSAGEEGIECSYQAHDSGSCSSSPGNIGPPAVRLGEDHASDPYKATWATSTADINCSVSDEYCSDSENGTQKVHVPVCWLINKEEGVHNCSENTCNFNIDRGMDTDLRPLMDYLVQLLENERLVLILLEINVCSD